jgi:hypothetical protein
MIFSDNCKQMATLGRTVTQPRTSRSSRFRGIRDAQMLAPDIADRPGARGLAMRSSSVLVHSLLFAAVLIAPTAEAKDGVTASLQTAIAPTAIEGNPIDVSWSLVDERTGEPFSACAVFIRLIGPTGKSTEGFAHCGIEAAEGEYHATVTVPAGGIRRIEIGVAGATTDQEGNRTRSDWLVPLANDRSQN